MITDETMRDNLTRHLSRLGKTTADLIAEIDSAFGSPLLSVAAGSILHGFGNITSDVDVHVVVDHPNVTDLPIPSMWPGAAVDVNYINATAIAEAATELVSADAAGPGTRAAWHDARRRLAQLSRLSLGLALDGTDEWRSWQTALRAPVVEAMIRWWRRGTRQCGAWRFAAC